MDLGPIIIDVSGTQLTEEDKELLKHPLVGGLIYFSRNFENPEQIRQLSNQVRATRKDALIMVDQEGGRVQRFKEGLSRLPSLRLLGRLWDAHPDRQDEILKFSSQLGALMSIEMLSLGIDLSLAPVVDIDKQLNEVIGERAFHHQPEPIAMLAASYIAGMEAAGMSATIKHFPGHGSVTQDSHVSLPVDERSEDQIREDLAPFKALVKQSNVNAVMPAHVIYNQLDARPAGFSKYWLQDILRGNLQFDGAIMSDDLTMQAAHVMGDYRTRAEEALAAGCDILLVCNSREGVIEILDSLKVDIDQASKNRIQKLRMQKVYQFSQLATHSLWKEATKGLKKFEGLCASLNPSTV